MTIEGTYGAAGLENVTTTNSGSSTDSRIKQKQLGQEEFFKLLTTQLASQDPLKPMEDTAFIAQMASFSELEMTSQLTKSFDEFTSVQQFNAAHSLIGKKVTMLDNGFHDGVVTAIENIDGETIAFLDGKVTGHSVDTIQRVEAVAP